jgi:hypothetical protein
MSFFTDASFVMDPNVYGVGKLYVPKPTDGTGDLTFTRASTGTRVNQDGLIEKVRTNLLTYSEQLDNAAWTKVVTTITANAIVAPDGTTTADKMADGSTATAARYTYQAPASSGTIYTSSGYFKKGEYNFVTLHAFGVNGAVFNLDTGVKVDQSGGIGSIESVGNGWYRCSFAFTAGGTAVFFSQSPAGNITYAGTTGSGIYAWGLQVETGDIATDYIPTTTSAVSVGPLANIPRLNYGSDGCPSLLLEPQRTNLLQYSDGLVPAQAFGATLTKNSIVSPDGYQNASLFTPSGGAGGVTLMTSSFSGYYTISVYLKGSVNGQKVRAFGDLQSTIIDWTITTEWVRYTATFNATNPTGQSIYLLAGSYFTPSQNNPFYVYGAQIEAGAYATSYIPTIAATTRGAEVCNLLSMSSGVASGATAGTLFIELEHKLNSTAGDSFVFGQTNGTFPAGRGYIYAADSGFADSFGGGGFAIPQSQTVKMIFRMNSLSNANIFQNGVKGATVSGTAWAAINSIQFRGAYASMKVKQILFSKSALTDAQCIELTTL